MIAGLFFFNLYHHERYSGSFLKVPRCVIAAVLLCGQSERPTAKGNRLRGGFNGLCMGRRDRVLYGCVRPGLIPKTGNLPMFVFHLL